MKRAIPLVLAALLATPATAGYTDFDRSQVNRCIGDLGALERAFQLMLASGAKDIDKSLESTTFSLEFLRQVAEANDADAVEQVNAVASERAKAVQAVAESGDRSVWQATVAALLERGSDCNRYVATLFERREAGTLKVE